MKVGLLITAYNRPEYLKKCLWSLERCDLSLVDEVLFINDASTDKETNDIIESLIRVPKYRIAVNNQNKGIKKCLMYGFELFWSNRFDLVINFDSDAIIRPDVITKLLEAYQSGTILTGFHSTTKNANGTERHLIINEFDKVYKKKSVGGINLCIDEDAYYNYVKPALQIEGNWDHNACIYAGGAYCLKESVVQHIGFDSSMNHTEQPDVADYFYYWHLPDVTLLGVDSEPVRLNKAKEICTKWIKFGNVVTLNPPINSKEAYSEFIINEAHKHVKTSHCLIFQHDGYVHNWQAWDNDWLQYDYIGAPWFYADGMAVGNGGFSLRSKILMELCAKIIINKHPEDHHICRTYRKELEAHGMKFAPVEVAEKFSFEGYRQPNKFLKDQFGVHGKKPRTAPGPFRHEHYVFNQFLSLGDILFLVPMARALMAEGNSIMWPIDKRYLSIAKHFPDIDFVDKDSVRINYDYMGRLSTPYGVLLPYRFANELLRKDLTHCMRAKYELYGHDYNMWRRLYWRRDEANEKKLIADLKLPEKFNLVNRYFGHKGELTIKPEITNYFPIVEMVNLPGYTLIDWIGVMEKATEIHAANSSILYLLELINLNIPIHLYARKIWGEKEFEYTNYLHTKPYILHS